MLSADSVSPHAEAFGVADDGPSVGLADILAWLGERKGTIAAVTLASAALAAGVSFLLQPVYTARASFLAPLSQQSSGSAATLAALGSLGGLGTSFTPKTPDELYVALLKSESVVRALDKRFNLRNRYELESYEALRKALPNRVRVSSDRKSGLIAVEVDDPDPAFAAQLANAHHPEVAQLLGRIAVSEAQVRRAFFQTQLDETKERLVRAEQTLRAVQERSGLIVLDKQAEALIGGAAQLRAQIVEREVQLKVLRTSATAQNPDVIRLQSELAALRSELSRMDSATDGQARNSAVDFPVGRLPEAAIDNVRARREVKLQETLLEGMIRQFELAKLDEAKEGPALQQVDVAEPPDRRSKPQRTLIVLAAALVGLVLASAAVVVSRYGRLARAVDPERDAAWRRFVDAWRLRRR
jgi:capsule polysaccharide export protein KpsE/RkpR